MACPHPVLSSAQNSSAPWRPLLRPHLPHVHPSHGSQHLLLLFLTSLAPAVSTAAVNQYVLNTSAPLPHSPPACLPGEPSSVAALEWLRAAGENRISKAAPPHTAWHPTSLLRVSYFSPLCKGQVVPLLSLECKNFCLELTGQ